MLASTEDVWAAEFQKGALPDYGRRVPAYELEQAAPDIWKVRLGKARLEYPSQSDDLLNRLGVGAPLAAYWGRMRLRYSITPR